jgi:uncharacterized membrane protein
MATQTIEAEPRRRKPITPDLLEKAVAIGALLMLAAMLAALARGVASWDRIPALVWLHLATIGTALALTPLLMLRKRGTRWHRRLGWAWSIAMFATATISLFVYGETRWSLIHIFSAVTIVSVPLLVMAARSHKVTRHRRIVRGLTLGALLIAGVFTLVPSRMLGHFLFG